MTDRRQLSEQSRRFNAMIADAVMRAEAEGTAIVPLSARSPHGRCNCPMGALAPQNARYPARGPCRVSRSFFVAFVNGFEDGRWSAPTGDTEIDEAYHLGRLYRARALRMHGGGE